MTNSSATPSSAFVSRLGLINVLKESVADKASKNDDRILFFVMHSTVAYDELIREEAKSLWKFTSSIETVLSRSLTPLVYLTLWVIAVPFIHEISGEYSWFTLPLFLLASIFLLWSFYLKRQSDRVLSDKLDEVASTIIGVGDRGLYYTVATNDGRVNVKLLQHEDVGIIDSASFYMKNYNTGKKKHRNEIVILDKFDNICVRFTDFIADKDVSVVAELEKLRDQNR